MPRFLLATFALVLGLSCSTPIRARQGAEAPALSPALELHSGFWINLHHFLYLEARLRSADAEAVSRESQAQPEYSSAISTGDLTPAEQKAWNAALSAYAADWSSRDLLQNGEMVLINDRLAEMENCADLSGKSAQQCQSGLQPNLIAALEGAAPVYRAHWWPQQDRENRAWIAGVAPLVRQMGSGLAAQLARIYMHRWAPGRLRVDVVWYAGPQGSYTSLDPIHVTIASHDSRNQGLAAFEMLFHEASHSLAEGVSEAIAQRCRQLGKPIPRDLWHALLFYTTGELVRRAVANSPTSTADSASPAGYTPYAYRNRVYERGWSDYQAALESYWQPYLDGKVDFQTAIARVVDAL